jgi:hypothetical protein
MSKSVISERNKRRKIEKTLKEDPNLKVEMSLEKKQPYIKGRKSFVQKATSEEFSKIAKDNVERGDIFQTNASNQIRSYGIGNTPLTIPHIIPLTRVASVVKQSIYDFYDASNGIVYEMTSNIGNSKAAKIEGDILSVKIWNPDTRYIAVVETEKNSETYRKNRSSFDLIEEQVDLVIYGEDELSKFLKDTYSPKNYHEGKLIDVDINEVDMLEVNREINEKWVDSLIDYILRFGFITNIVVVPYRSENGSIRYKIIDGNHRFSAKKKLIESGIFPMGKDGSANKNKIQVLSLDWIDGNNTKLVHQICIQMNMTNKSWDNYDYIQSYIKFFHNEGLERQLNDYQLLANTYNEFGQSMTALYITVNEGLRNYDKGMGRVKEGKWECDKSIYNHITRPILDLLKEIRDNEATAGKFTNTALQSLLTFVKMEMISRYEDSTFIKLFDGFRAEIIKGRYKRYFDVNGVKEVLIPKLEKEFNKTYPIK